MNTANCPSLPELELKEVWRANGVYQILSSPHTADLDADGILDVVVGSGSEIANEGAITAFNGSDGSVLWSVKTQGEMFGSAQFADLNNDDKLDAILGGRSSQLFAISGSSGEVIWQFDEEQTQRSHWFQFYTGQFIPDVNADGIVDWLTANGGDPKARPFEPRANNYLVILSGKDGKVIAVADTPDNAETYMSVYYYSPDQLADPIIVFGTGGETRAGSLWQTTLEDILVGDISSAKRLANSTKKGFIAPPALADLNTDGVLDIVATAFDGQIAALDGKSNNSLWSLVLEQAETYSTPALGYFTEDIVPDVFAYYSRGKFPSYKGAVVLLLDGKTGETIWSLEDENNYAPSPLAIDINNDGRDEVIFSKGTYLPENPQGPVASFELLLFDTCTFDLQQLQSGNGVAASTPTIVDLEDDGKLELIYANFTLEDTWQLIRIDLNIPTPTRRAWSAYLGTNYDGHFQP